MNRLSTTSLLSSPVRSKVESLQARQQTLLLVRLQRHQRYLTSHAWNDDVNPPTIAEPKWTPANNSFLLFMGHKKRLFWTEPTLQDMSILIKLCGSSSQRIGCSNYQYSRNGIRQWLKHAWKLRTLKVLLDLLLAVCVLCIHLGIRHHAVSVLQIYVGHISQCLVESCWSLPQLSRHIVLLAYRTGSFCEIIGMQSWSETISLLWQ